MFDNECVGNNRAITNSNLNYRRSNLNARNERQRFNTNIDLNNLDLNNIELLFSFQG